MIHPESSNTFNLTGFRSLSNTTRTTSQTFFKHKSKQKNRLMKIGQSGSMVQTKDMQPDLHELLHQKNKSVNVFRSLNKFCMDLNQEPEVQVNCSCEKKIETLARCKQTKIDQYLENCNINKIDENYYKTLYSKYKKKGINGKSMRNQSDQLDGGSLQKQLQNFKHFRFLLPSSNFTLKHLEGNSSQSQSLEAFNRSSIMKSLNKNKLSSLKDSDSKPFELGQKEGFSVFQGYTKVQPIRRYDMVFDVKQLLRLYEKREQQLIEGQADPQLQLEIIRRKNQIALLLSKCQKMEKVNQLQTQVAEQIQQYYQDAETIVDKFRRQYQLH